MPTIKIGEIIEEGRTLTRCPGYYAADYEKLELEPGRYPLYVTIEGGYMFPMPYWLVASIPARRIEGKTYSGFGGVNFASTDLPQEDVTYGVQAYAYSLAKMIEDGRVELSPGFELLAEDRLAFGRTLAWGEGLLAPAAKEVV